MKEAALILGILLALHVCGRGAPEEIVVVGYNVENYLGAEQPDGKKHEKSSQKPEKEKAALFHIIKEINPDILGVCEMGPKDQFEDFKRRLDAAGLGYKDFEYVQGADPQRHLALASRYPIVARDSVSDASYKLNGTSEKVTRGFLDVTVQITPDYQLRLIGAHLKSKLAARSDETLMRRNEAHLLRQHIAKILADNPHTNLLVYGDFNDTKNEPSIQEIMSPRSAPDHLYDLYLKDSHGERWTHYWKHTDIYSRIDFIFVNRALMPEIIHDKSRVDGGDDWNAASDHRPVVTTIRPVNAGKN